jgi:hypothetical protein
MLPPPGILFGVVFGLAFLVLWGDSAAWVINDAQMRGRSGCAPVIVLGIGGPCAALI